MTEAFQQPELMGSMRRWARGADFPQPEGKGPAGRPFCRWCHREVPKGRRSWCSDECVNEYWIRMSGHTVRTRVEERDHGICAICEMDAEKLNRVLMDCGPWAESGRRQPWSWRTSILSDLGMTAFGESVWQPDHILPVALGGGMCGLSNYRTLCTACHLGVTQKQAQVKGKVDRLARQHAEHKALYANQLVLT